MRERVVCGAILGRSFASVFIVCNALWQTEQLSAAAEPRFSKLAGLCHGIVFLLFVFV